MMTIRALVAAAIASLPLMLSACDNGGPAENVTKISVANPHSDQLKALDPQMRHLGLMRAIRDNGRRCKRVEAGAYQQEYRGMAMWVALCDDGRHWAIFIAPNADVQVRGCTEMDTLDLPQCRPVSGAGATPARSS